MDEKMKMVAELNKGYVSMFTYNDVIIRVSRVGDSDQFQGFISVDGRVALETPNGDYKSVCDAAKKLIDDNFSAPMDL